MKKGKSCVIKGYKQIKCSYGTVDSKNLKSIYLNIQSWVEPKGLEMDWARPVSILNKNIKSTLTEILNQNLFNDKFIVDLDLRTSGIKVDKASFLNLEITFFTKENIEFKSENLSKELNHVLKEVYDNVLKKSKYFTIQYSKNKLKNKNFEIF